MAYASAVARCSTAVAPWFVAPANRNRYRSWAVAQLMIETMEGMNGYC
jgi:polyphosphate kinase 2 (PPK2 family)